MKTINRVILVAALVAALMASFLSVQVPAQAGMWGRSAAKQGSNSSPAPDRFWIGFWDGFAAIGFGVGDH